MPERILYEFDGFRLDPLRRSLRHGRESRSLTPKAFELLLVFVQNPGVILSKGELIKLVWSEAIVSDNNFNVTLNAARKALGESGGEHRYIIKVSDGYRFVADVRIVPIGTDPQSSSAARSFDRWHLLHIVVSSMLYAALYGSAVFLEVAYEFDRYRRSAFILAPIVLGWILFTSIAALVIDRKRIFRTKRNGLSIAILIFFIAGGVVFVGLTRFLPNLPITQMAFPAYPAQAAFLKDVAYFLVLALLFLIIPFHFVTAMEHEMEDGHGRSVLDTLMARKLAVPPSGTIYLRFGHLALVLMMFAVISIAMTAHLLDNLQPGIYRNLFTQLVYLRGILYFGLGIQCLAWYYSALVDLKRDCTSRIGDGRD